MEPDESLPVDLLALKKFAFYMDEAIRIPGTKRKVGLDAGLGLIPGVGDAIGALLSAWIVVGALRHRVPIARILQMIFYIIADFGLGSVPILGDLFDFAFEENVMNLKLLLRHRDRNRPPRSLKSVALAAGVAILVILAGGLLVAGVLLFVVLWLIHNR